MPMTSLLTSLTGMAIDGATSPYVVDDFAYF